jgi:hypothetical protein
MDAMNGRLALPVIQALPNDLVFTSPTVGKLVSFIYGLAVCAAALPNISIRAADLDTPYVHKHVPPSILDCKDDTIVRLRESAVDEPPLILVHGACRRSVYLSPGLTHLVVGGGGFIYSFLYLQTHFRTGLWAIQVTSETPRTSFVAQTDFYFRKIKVRTPIRGQVK